MKSQGKGKGRLSPYLTYATWQRLLPALRENPPSRLDQTYLTDLGFSASTAVTVRGALAFLELLNPGDEPKQKLLALANAEGESRRALLKEIIQASYQPILGDLDLEHATLGQVQESFRRHGADNNVGHKCLSFFLALAKDAGITLSPNLLIRSRVGTTAQRSTPQAPPSLRRRATSSPRRQTSQKEVTGWRHMIGKFPDFDPGWAKEAREEWLDRFQTLQTLMVLMDKFPPLNPEWSAELQGKWFDCLREFVGKSPVSAIPS